MNANGEFLRNGRYVDIPLEIGLPHFVHDDTMADSGAALGNFKLVLQSVVCHRGRRIDSGHYVSIVRGLLPNHAKRDRTPGSKPEDCWILFDDLAEQRVTYVNVRQTLLDETPYLLFYQVIPIEEGEGVDDGRNPSDSDLYETTPPRYSIGEFAENVSPHQSGPHTDSTAPNGKRASGMGNNSSEESGETVCPGVPMEDQKRLSRPKGLSAPAAIPRPKGRNSSKTRENRLSSSLKGMMAATAFADAGEKGKSKKEKAKTKGKTDRDCTIM